LKKFIHFRYFFATWVFKISVVGITVNFGFGEDKPLGQEGLAKLRHTVDTMEPASRTLSPKLHRLIQLASLGMTDKEIATEMEVSPNTVESHWKRLRVLYATSSRTRIVADALQGLLRDTQLELQAARNRAEELEQELARLQSASTPKSLDNKSAENITTLEAVLGTFPVLAFRLEANGRDAQFMGNGVTRYGFMPHEFTSGMIQLSDLIHPEDLTYLQESGYFPRPNRRGECEALFRVSSAKGDARWILERVRPMLNEQEAVVGYQGIWMDVSGLIGSPFWPKEVAQVWHQGRTIMPVPARQSTSA